MRAPYAVSYTHLHDYIQIYDNCHAAPPIRSGRFPACKSRPFPKAGQAPLHTADPVSYTHLIRKIL